MVIVSTNIKKTIESIKEVVGNHLDSDVYNALEESNMDINEAIEKLLHQDTFHEVRKRRDNKKENTDYNGQVETRKHSDYTSHGHKFYSYRNDHRGGYTRRESLKNAGISREFRVVKDKVNESSAKSTKPVTLSGMARRIYNLPERSAYGVPDSQRHSDGQSDQNFDGGPDFGPKQAPELNYDTRKEQNEHQLQSNSSASSNAVGVYASASAPVHVPSPESRPSVAIGVVGGCRVSFESGPNQSYQQSVSFSNTVLESSSERGSIRHISSVSQSDQDHGTAESRFSNQFSNTFHQLPVGQKGVLPSKEWKPKVNQKPSVSSPGVIRSLVKSTSHQTVTFNSLEKETKELQDKLSQTNIHCNQKVIIAQNIRVSEFDRSRMSFGSIGMKSDSIDNRSCAFQAADVAEKADGEEPMGGSLSNSQDGFDDQVQNSATSNPSSEPSDSVRVHNNENYLDMSLVSNNLSFTTLKSQLQESIELPNFSVYDPQPVYDMPYFRPVDDAVCGTRLPSNQEALSLHTANTVSNSSVAMMQHQTHMNQMYPQLHLSQFSNVTPYRQFVTPMFVPPMVPGYTGNLGYPQLSNGSSYILMPGTGSHVPANGHSMYGIQQFKPFPDGDPAVFGGLASPNGYAVNAPGVVGGPRGSDNSSRLRYKDSNLYVPNPQVETSEVWIQNHRKHSGTGQTGHPAYMQPHATNSSFNAATQLSQLQLPGMHPPQPAGNLNSRTNF